MKYLFIMKVFQIILRVAFVKIFLNVLWEHRVGGGSPCFQKKLFCSKRKLEKRKVTPE